MRIALIFGLLIVLAFVFAAFRRPLSNIPSQFHELTHHNESSVASLIQDCNASSKEAPVRWSDFAYVQYVTNPNYLCNSLMILEALRRHGTKAELLMLYPQGWEVPAENASNAPYESRLLAQARDLYNTKLRPIQVKRFENKDDPTWQDSYTKLLAWNQTQYKRLISLDSDATVLDHMDELFLLPPAPVAMPRAYWMDHFFLSSQLIVVEPSETEWQRVQDAVEHHDGNDYDMDILNKLYGTSSIVIPHRKYDLLTGELSGEKHEAYLGSSKEIWNIREVLGEAKFVHFSDWPMPKPWLEAKQEDWDKYKPKCRRISETEYNCSDQEAWLELRRDFSARREVGCGHLARDNATDNHQRICGQAYDGKAPDHQKRATLRPKYEPLIM
ncbi:nucleotide-diphospho-sugar transferase [Byssothecium circinans]|uniref:Nucleotide-diphospho-sugar transferase n=1 Tax=Byssothecium circinans TaxID=147558 RepID=A0A6A5UFT8_9PLEO|nr:nucleotide-diphospho-sugar transferase [Byssothecium circinans]